MVFTSCEYTNPSEQAYTCDHCYMALVQAMLMSVVIDVEPYLHQVMQYINSALHLFSVHTRMKSPSVFVIQPDRNVTKFLFYVPLPRRLRRWTNH